MQLTQVNPDLPQHQVQQLISLPQLRPAALRTCLQWLHDREVLLRSELMALQSKAPASCNCQRQEVSFLKYFQPYKSNCVTPHTHTQTRAIVADAAQITYNQS